MPGLCHPCGSDAATPFPGSGSTGENPVVSNQRPLTPKAVSVLGKERLPFQNQVGPLDGVDVDMRVAPDPNSVVKFDSSSCTQIVRDAAEDT